MVSYQPYLILANVRYGSETDVEFETTLKIKIPQIGGIFSFTSVHQEARRTRLMSRSGGAPNKRVYSRLNWDALS